MYTYVCIYILPICYLYISRCLWNIFIEFIYTFSVCICMYSHDRHSYDAFLRTELLGVLENA